MAKTSNVASMPLPKSTIGRVVTTALRHFFRFASPLAPRLTAQLALKLFLRPPKPARPSWEQRILASARRFDLAVNAHRIAMWTWGDLQGKVVLLVHGWGGRGSQLGAFVDPLLDAGYSVVAFDAPGHGDSSGKLSSLPFIEEALRGVAENIGPLAGVIAHSAGAAVTNGALNRGLDAERLIFLAPGVDPFHFIGLFGSILGINEEVQDLMRQGIEKRFGIAITDYQAIRRAPSQLTPLLVAHDRLDNETPYEAARELAEVWPRARFHGSEGLGHRRILRDDTVIRASLQFLAEGRSTANLPPFAMAG